jgi:hypothetical protein
MCSTYDVTTFVQTRGLPENDVNSNKEFEEKSDQV